MAVAVLMSVSMPMSMTMAVAMRMGMRMRVSRRSDPSIRLKLPNAAGVQGAGVAASSLQTGVGQGIEDGAEVFDGAFRGAR